MVRDKSSSSSSTTSNFRDVVNRFVSMAENKFINKEGVSAPIIVSQAKWKVLAGGAVAGFVVDTSLYPIDTVKSRLQSKEGFIKSGGFKHLYRGLPPVLVASIPNENKLIINDIIAAFFFITYETIKDKLHEYKQFNTSGKYHVLNHVIAASFGEVAACTARVPSEIIKMRSQTTSPGLTNLAIFKEVIAREGPLGMYRGFISTVFRDLPFSAIQFPIWERFKLNHLKKHNRHASSIESAYYGSIAGAIAAFLTTPLDVAKTRIMLADRADSLASGKISLALKEIYTDRGIKGLFAGVLPRCLWISVGAAIFLGSYEQTIKLLSSR